MYSREELVNKIIEYGRRCGEKNYTPGYSGNISARFEKGMLITVSGSSNGYLTPDDLVYTGFNGTSNEEGKKPSSEKYLHIGIYKKRPEFNYVIHVHAPFLSSFACAGRDLLAPVMAENVFYFGGIPLAKYALPSTRELVHNTVKFFDKYDAVLMANHGFVIASKTIEDAYMKLELAESYAQVVLNTEILGGANELNASQAREILKLRK